MKQFARCTNCRQWYTRAFTTAVEVYTGGRRRRMAVWCLRCVHAAEQRSAVHHTPAWQTSDRPTADGASSLPDFQALVQEHLQLMERAIHEDEAVIVPVVEDFMQRCLQKQQQLETPELAQRLLAHVRYWETFLRTLRQSR